MLGKIILSINDSAMRKDKNEFLKILSSIEYWDYEKLSLWIFEDALNYIDELLNEKTLNDNLINENTEDFLIILKFLKLVILNNSNKDVFSSFDHLTKIFNGSNSLEIKILISDIYFVFKSLKKSLSKNIV